MTKLTKLAREVLPPVLTRLIRPPAKYGPWGKYPSWEAAAAEATPYRSYFPTIDDHLKQTMLGKFEPPCFHGVHLAAILALPKPVKVLDFGGGIALAYFRAMRTVPSHIKWWKVVDLPDVVEHGRKVTKDTQLSFHHSIEDALGGETPDVVTCSSVLQCMEDSYGTLKQLFSVGAKNIVLDRLPLEDEERFSLFHTVSGDKIAWRVLSRFKLREAAGRYHKLFEQKHQKHPTAPDASDEYCLFFTML